MEGGIFKVIFGGIHFVVFAVCWFYEVSIIGARLVDELYYKEIY